MPRPHIHRYKPRRRSLLRRGQPRRQQPVHRPHRVHPRRAHPAMSAVVQQKVRPAPPPPVPRNALVQIGQNPLHANRIPVVPRHIPQYRRQSQLARRTQHIWPPRSVRWPEELHRRSRNLLQHGVAIRQLPPHSRRALRSTAADGSSCGCPLRDPPQPHAAQSPVSRAQNLPSQRMSREPRAAPVPPATANVAASFGPSSKVSATSSASSPAINVRPKICDVGHSDAYANPPAASPSAAAPAATSPIARLMPTSSLPHSPSTMQRPPPRVPPESPWETHAAAAVPSPCPARSHT